MAYAPPAEADQLQLYRQFCTNLTQAETLRAGVDACITIVEAYFAPRSCEIVWATNSDSRLPDPDPVALAQRPDTDELLRLKNGEIVIRSTGDHLEVCFAPLQARGALIGWLAIFNP